MLPITLAPTLIRAALVGAGPLAARRLALARAGGVEPRIFVTDADDTALRDAAGVECDVGLPTDEDLRRVNIVFVAGLSVDSAEPLAERARRLNVLVNVEDVLPLCDFHVPAIVRRGDLTLTIATGGKGPGLARLLRARLEALFPESWAERLTSLGALREQLRQKGADGATINKEIERVVTENGWLP